MIEQAQNNYYGPSFGLGVGGARDKLPLRLYIVPLGVWRLSGSRVDNILYAEMLTQLNYR